MLTTFKGFLRRHRPAQLNVWGDAAFRLAFPLFSPAEWSEHDKQQYLQKTNFDYILFVDQQSRRFAGNDLARGSYSSVASNEKGYDWLTLVSELNAYRDAKDDQFFAEAIDGSVVAPDYFGQTLPDSISNILSTCILVRIFPASRLLPFVNNRTAEMGQPDAVKNLTEDTILWVILLPEVASAQIEKVVDLRFPETRESFFNVFQTGIPLDAVPEVLEKPFFSRPMGDNISDFSQMLPELLWDSVAGDDANSSGVTQAIGDYLRARGVKGLVYPSARCDVFSEFNNGILERFGGWNFVDYRSSPPPFLKNFVKFAPWDQLIPKGTSINSPKSGPFAGSFQIKGLREFNLSEHDRAKRSVADRMSESQRSIVVWGSTTLDELFAGPAARRTYRQFGEFLNAAMGTLIEKYGIERTTVRNAMDWLLDRGHLAEFAGKCASTADGCNDDDMRVAVREILEFLKRPS